jgi:hypothetical protein
MSLRGHPIKLEDTGNKPIKTSVSRRKEKLPFPITLALEKNIPSPLNNI